MFRKLKNSIIFSFLIFPVCLNIASANCTKPSGSYVGSQGGQAFTNGSLYNNFAELYSFNFNSNGSGSGDFVSKDTAASAPLREYNLSFNWVSASNTFDTSKCRGTLSMTTSVSGTRKLLYVSYNSGANVDILWYDDQDLVINSILKLSKQ